MLKNLVIITHTFSWVIKVVVRVLWVLFLSLLLLYNDDSPSTTPPSSPKPPTGEPELPKTENAHDDGEPDYYYDSHSGVVWFMIGCFVGVLIGLGMLFFLVIVFTI